MDTNQTISNDKYLMNTGVVVSVRGSVVDIVFDEYLPPINSLLHAREGKIAIEVLSQLDAHRVRGIALTPTQGLARGMLVEDSGGPLQTYRWVRVFCHACSMFSVMLSIASQRRQTSSGVACIMRRRR